MLSCLAGELGLTVIDRLQGDSINYVNIPISPTSKRQLHYMELDLQDRPESSHTVRGTLCSSDIYYLFSILQLHAIQPSTHFLIITFTLYTTIQKSFYVFERSVLCSNVK